MSNCAHALRALLVLAALAATARLHADGAPQTRPAVRGSIFQPADFPSLGKLVVAKGQSVTFDTGSATTQPSVSGAASGKGSLGISRDASVQAAVFAFDSVQLAEGAKVTITGDRALVIVASGAVTIDTTLDVGGRLGAPRAGTPGGSGGPGGEGGECRKALQSNQPPVDGGDGGRGMKDSGVPGRGFGAGFNHRVKGGVAGGGGGYGGAGRATSEGSNPMGRKPGPMPGGAPSLGRLT